MERWWDDTDRGGEWSDGGMILTGESGAMVEWYWQGEWSDGGMMILTGGVEYWWDDTERGEWSDGGMILTRESGAMVE